LTLSTGEQLRLISLFLGVKFTLEEASNPAIAVSTEEDVEAEYENEELADLLKREPTKVIPPQYRARFLCWLRLSESKPSGFLIVI
jgi:hypothetical protein